jgi:hypothetical protein
MLKLKDLPNTQGFEFVGIAKDGNEIPCYVHNSLDSGYIVLSCHTNNRMYDKLKGWKKVSSVKS